MTETIKNTSEIKRIIESIEENETKTIVIMTRVWWNILLDINKWSSMFLSVTFIDKSSIAKIDRKRRKKMEEVYTSNCNKEIIKRVNSMIKICWWIKTK